MDIRGEGEKCGGSMAVGWGSVCRRLLRWWHLGEGGRGLKMAWVVPQVV